MDTWLRSWPLVVIPMVILPLAAIGVAIKAGGTASVSADVWAGQASTAQLAFSSPYTSPAADASGELTQLLQTRRFDLAIAHMAPLYWRATSSKPDRSAWIVQDLSRNISVQTKGSNLLHISCKEKNPLIGLQLIRAVLRAGSHEIARLSQQQAEIAVSRYTKQAQAARAQLNLYAHELGSYLRKSHLTTRQIGGAALTDPKLANLYQLVQSAQLDVRNANQSIAAASQPPARNPLVTIDEPSSAAAGVTKKTLLLDGGIGLVLALLLGAGFVVVATARDHSLRREYEVRQVVGLDVLTVLPYSPHSPPSKPARAVAFAGALEDGE